MAKKKGITPTTALGGPTSTLGSGNIYTGTATNQPPTISTVGSTANSIYHIANSSGNSTTFTWPINFRSLAVTDGFYEDDGRLFWENSKGEVFQVTFTKQETVKQILEDL